MVQQNEPKSRGVVHSKLAEHQTDALLNQIADEVHLQQANAGNDGIPLSFAFNDSFSLNLKSIKFHFWFNHKK